MLISVTQTFSICGPINMNLRSVYTEKRGLLLLIVFQGLLRSSSEHLRRRHQSLQTSDIICKNFLSNRFVKAQIWRKSAIFASSLYKCLTAFINIYLSNIQLEFSFLFLVVIFPVKMDNICYIVCICFNNYVCVNIYIYLYNCLCVQICISSHRLNTFVPFPHRLHS